MQCFYIYRDAKEISFYYFRDTKLWVKHGKTHVNSIYTAGIMLVRKMNGVSLNFFHSEFRVSTEIMGCDYCITKRKTFSACGELLMVLQATFFATQNVYVNLNPG